jgi:hypothetical protein
MREINREMSTIEYNYPEKVFIVESDRICEDFELLITGIVLSFEIKKGLRVYQ